jgi:hypothetical protein
LPGLERVEDVDWSDIWDGSTDFRYSIFILFNLHGLENHLTFMYSTKRGYHSIEYVNFDLLRFEGMPKI